MFCPNCGKVHEEGTVFCDLCGSNMTEEGNGATSELQYVNGMQGAQAPFDQSMQAQTQPFPYGQPMQGQTQTLPYVQPMQGQAQAQPPANGPAQGKSNPSFVVIAIIVVVVIAIAAFFLMQGEDAAESGTGAAGQAQGQSFSSSAASSASSSSVASASAGTQVYDPPVFGFFDTSSVLAPDSTTSDYGGYNAIDGVIETAWNEGAPGDGTGEWLQLSSGTPQHVTSVSIMGGYPKPYRDGSDVYYKNNRPRQITISYDGGSQAFLLQDLRGQFQICEFPQPVDTTFIRITIDSVYKGANYDDCCIAEVEVY